MPLDYPNNAYSIWSFAAPHGFSLNIRIEQFNIQKDADFIHIGDGVETFNRNSTHWRHITGQIGDIWDTRTISFKRRSVTIIFTSDCCIASLGFLITCSPVVNQTEKPGNLTKFINYQPLPYASSIFICVNRFRKTRI